MGFPAAVLGCGKLFCFFARERLSDAEVCGIVTVCQFPPGDCSKTGGMPDCGGVILPDKAKTLTGLTPAGDAFRRRLRANETQYLTMCIYFIK